MPVSAGAAPSRYVFIHIGKTGGSAVRGAIQSQFPASRVCPHVFARELSDLPDEALSRYRLFCAHIGYEQAAVLGDRLFTVLRDPVERVLSLYAYWREVSPTGRGRGPALAKSHDLEAFLELEEAPVEAAVHNTQTWQLAFAHDVQTRRVVARSHSMDAVYRRAVDNLENLDVVGLQEALPAFMASLEKAYGWRLPPLPVVNATARRPDRASVSRAALAKIERLNAADLELYALVRSRLG